MLKIVLISAFWVLCHLCAAQVKEKVDTLKIDSAQVEQIHKMPMDTTHVKNPGSKAFPDSIPHHKTMDDVDPDKPKNESMEPGKPKRRQ